MFSKLELTSTEARVLRDHLSRLVSEVDQALIHTDKRELQRQLVRDESQLRGILNRLEMLIEDHGARAPTPVA